MLSKIFLGQITFASMLQHHFWWEMQSLVFYNNLTILTESRAVVITWLNGRTLACGEQKNVP